MTRVKLEKAPTKARLVRCRCFFQSLAFPKKDGAVWCCFGAMFCWPWSFSSFSKWSPLWKLRICSHWFIHVNSKRESSIFQAFFESSFKQQLQSTLAYPGWFLRKSVLLRLWSACASIVALKAERPTDRSPTAEISLWRHVDRSAGHGSAIGKFQLLQHGQKPSTNHQQTIKNHQTSGAVRNNNNMFYV